MLEANQNEMRKIPRIFLYASLGLLATCVLIAGYFLFVREEYQVLEENLSPTDAALIVKELDTLDVDYKISPGGHGVLVPHSRLEEVRLSIIGADLVNKGTVGFELFDDSEMGLTEFAQKIKYQRAVQGELLRTIKALDGVQDARIHISIPERSVFEGENSVAKAAVTLVPSPREQLTRYRVEGVRELVAAGITGLNANNVIVLNARGEIIRQVQPVEENTLVDDKGIVASETLSVAPSFVEQFDSILKSKFPDLVIRVQGLKPSINEELENAEKTAVVQLVSELALGTDLKQAFYLRLTTQYLLGDEIKNEILALANQLLLDADYVPSKILFHHKEELPREAENVIQNAIEGNNVQSFSSLQSDEIYSTSVVEYLQSNFLISGIVALGIGVFGCGLLFFILRMKRDGLSHTDRLKFVANLKKEIGTGDTGGEA